VINFRDWPEERAKEYPDCYAIVSEKVKPERNANTFSRHAREHWWQYERTRAELYAAIADMERVLFHSFTSKFVQFGFAPSDNIVFAGPHNVIAIGSFSGFAVVQSSFHDVWCFQHASTMETRLRYACGDLIETFPFPVFINDLEEVGERYYAHRAALMKAHKEGLTKTYNRFHTAQEQAEDIAALRAIHVEMDRSVAVAYGWGDLVLGHGFHETKQGVRYTISESARRRVLDRLLALNHERYAEELRAGLHDTGKPKARAAKAVVAKVAEAATTLPVQPGLFDAPVGRAVAGPRVTGLDGPSAALLVALEAATGPLGKAALVAAAGLDEGAWTGAIGALKAQGLVEQRGEKRGATYLRRQDR
jgi:hypothetical protein